MKIRTIEWKNNKIKIIDQRKLPDNLQYFYIQDLKSLSQAIKTLQIRGAPALGAAAALGVYLGIKNLRLNNFSKFKKQLDNVINYIASSRPTARNLFWALERIKAVVLKNKHKSISYIKRIIFQEAKNIIEEDRLACRNMARFGAKLIKNNDRILTVCNAGKLATIDYGTALGVIYKAKEQGKRIKVYASETRPLLQGARLTAWELKEKRIDVTLICDNMAADLMRKKIVDKVLVGADRIAANGDTANKIGTYNLACLAKFHKIPFYIAAPISTFDLTLNSGKSIPIEQRDSREVTHIQDRGIAPSKVKVYNPAFDVTPARLIRAIITERGIIRPPFKKNIQASI